MSTYLISAIKVFVCRPSVICVCAVVCVVWLGSAGCRSPDQLIVHGIGASHTNTQTNRAKKVRERQEQDWIAECNANKRQRVRETDRARVNHLPHSLWPLCRFAVSIQPFPVFPVHSLSRFERISSISSFIQ